MRHRFLLSLVRRSLSLSRSFSASPAAPAAGVAPVALRSHQSTERVSAIVDEISGLTLLEVADLTEALRARLGLDQMPVMAFMSHGMSLGGASVGATDAPEAAAAAEEKSAFDLKLESYEAAAKIKIIKEVRMFTDLGLKEAKELVEKAPAVLKKGVSKEEAEKIVEKMKEIGAKVILE